VEAVTCYKSAAIISSSVLYHMTIPFNTGRWNNLMIQYTWFEVHWDNKTRSLPVGCSMRVYYSLWQIFYFALYTIMMPEHVIIAYMWPRVLNKYSQIITSNRGAKVCLSPSKYLALGCWNTLTVQSRQCQSDWRAVGTERWLHSDFLHCLENWTQTCP